MIVLLYLEFTKINDLLFCFFKEKLSILVKSTPYFYLIIKNVYDKSS